MTVLSALRSSKLVTWKPVRTHSLLSSVCFISNFNYSLNKPTSIISSKPNRTLSSWFFVQTGKLQQTLAGYVERKGISLHSGKVSTVRLCPGFAGQGRYFDFRSNLVPASAEFAQVSPLCTTLCKDGLRIRTVEHLLSALEAAGVDNCRIEIENLDDQDNEAEVKR